MVLKTGSACPQPADPTAADCSGNQQVTDEPSSSWGPAVTMIAADCTNPSLTSASLSYQVFLTPTSGAGALPALPAVNLRWASGGNRAVYMTVAPTGSRGGSPYEEADIELVTGGAGAATALTYEGPLG